MNTLFNVYFKNEEDSEKVFLFSRIFREWINKRYNTSYKYLKYIGCDPYSTATNTGTGETYYTFIAIPTGKKIKRVVKRIKRFGDVEKVEVIKKEESFYW